MKLWALGEAPWGIWGSVSALGATLVSKEIIGYSVPRALRVYRTAIPFMRQEAYLALACSTLYIYIYILIRILAHSTSRAAQVAMADNIESTPGTFLLVDTRGDIRTNHAHGTGADKDIILVPAPSSHPDDPLNWSPRRKKLSAMCMAALVILEHPSIPGANRWNIFSYVLVIGICSSSLYSTLGPLSKATGLSYDNLNSGTGYMVYHHRGASY